MNGILDATRSGRFSASFSFHDSAETIAALEAAAAAAGTSTATVARSAVRLWLEQYGTDLERRP